MTVTIIGEIHEHTNQSAKSKMQKIMIIKIPYNNRLHICVVHSGFDTHVSRQFQDKCLQIVLNSGISGDTVANWRIFVLKFVLKLSWFWRQFAFISGKILMRGRIFWEGEDWDRGRILNLKIYILLGRFLVKFPS